VSCVTRGQTTAPEVETLARVHILKIYQPHNMLLSIFQNILNSRSLYTTSAGSACDYSDKIWDIYIHRELNGVHLSNKSSSMSSKQYRIETIYINFLQMMIYK